MTVRVRHLLWNLLAVWALLLCGCSMCGNEIGYEELSPDGKFKAVVFERDCGATTRASTQISILPKSESLTNEAGNIFIAKGDLRIAMQWISTTELSVTYPPGTTVFRKQEQKDGITIRFVESR